MAEAFTAGIEHGGLTTDYEVRILVCWLLHKVRTPATMTQLNEALQQDALVNYFELARAISQLLSTGHLKEAEHPKGTEAPLILTAIGAETGETFERSLPLSVREKSIAALETVLKRARSERENAVRIAKTSDGYRMTIQIADVKSDLLFLTFYVPTQELCDRMRERFLDDPSALYRVIADYLSGKTSLEKPEEKPE